MFKNRWNLVAGVLGAGLLTLLLVPSLHAQPNPALTVGRNFAAPAQPAPQTIYRLVPLFKTTDEVRGRAAQAGIAAQSLRSLKTTGTLNTVRDATWTFHLDTDRQLETLMDNEVLSGRYGRSLRVPADADCRAAALAFLGQRQLVAGSADEELVYERTNELLRGYRGAADRGPAAAPTVVLREVVFAKSIKGVRCTGPGTHLSVFVGDRGKVLGYVSNWMPAVATADRAEVAPLDDTFRRLTTDLAARDTLIPELNARGAQATARQCRYVLATAADRNGGFVALPAFEYRGQITDRRRRAADFTRVVPAVRDARTINQRLLAPLTDAVENAPATRGGLRLPVRGVGR